MTREAPSAPETTSAVRQEENSLSRRQVLEVLGGGAIVSGLLSCNGNESQVSTPPARELTTDLYYSSVRALASGIQSRRVSSLEVVQAFLERIEVVNGRINAVVQLAGEEALDQAREADARLAKGELAGPLHGVPMTIKDSLDTAGMISTGGTQGRASFIPENDATVVARLRGAGAILMGKTNTPELTLSYETDNAIYGRTNNPYDLTRTPGGSSGGASAILAAGGSPFDVGSDYGGSVRLPSHCCGTAGIKPTSGRVPRTGHVYPFGGILDAFQQLGPMARYVEDLTLLLPILSGPDWIDPAIVPMPLGEPQEVALRNLRVSFHTDNGIMSPTRETAEVIRAAARTLSDAGLEVDEARPEGIESTYEIVNTLWNVCDPPLVKRLLQDAGTRRSECTLNWLYELPPASDTVIVDAVRQGDACRSAMAPFFKDYDVILSPVNALPAMPHASEDAQNLKPFSYTMTYNLTGWPGAVVRGGTSPEGLPIGVQIVARPWREDVVLAVAQFLETALGGFQAPSS